MKRTSLTIMIVAISAALFSQQFQWAKGEGLWAYDYGYGITTDESGNVYVAGKYELQAKFSNSVITCEGNHDGFLVKYNPQGALQWIRTCGGKDGDYAEAIYCDRNKYILISGEMEGYSAKIMFPPTAMTLNCVGDNDAFFAKYDLDGNLLMVKGEGGINSEKALGITCDNSGNIFICGYFTQSTVFNGQNITGYGGRDIYVAKYDSTGTFKWFKKAGSSGRDEAKFVKCDAEGNVYICGLFSNGANFEGQTKNTFHGTAYYDAFIAKYSTDGNLIWVKTGGSDVHDIAWSMTIDNGGTIYIGGEFSAYAEFGNYNIMSAGMLDIFAAAYNSSGDVLWLKRAGGTMVDRARAIGTDGTSLFLTGQFGGSATFGSQNITAADSSDVYFSALDNSGNFLWTSAIGGPPDTFEPLGYESGNAICARSGGLVYATGGMLADTTSGMDKNMFGGISVPFLRRTDVFVVSLTWDATTVGIEEDITSSSPVIYPNPAKNSFHILSRQDVTAPVVYSISNSLGQVVTSGNFISADTEVCMPEHCPLGIYFVELRSGENTIARKKLILKN